MNKPGKMQHSPSPLDRFLEARQQMASASGEGSLMYQEANEGMWAAVSEAIIVQLHGGDPVPQEMLFELGFELGHWLSGIPSPRLPLLTRRGRRPSPVVRNCQVIAIMYVVASPRLTGDRRFRQSVKESFRIADSTIQAWKNRFESEALAKLETFQSNLTDEQRGSLIRVLMEKSGDQYRSMIKRPQPARQLR